MKKAFILTVLRLKKQLTDNDYFVSPFFTKSEILEKLC